MDYWGTVLMHYGLCNADLAHKRIKIIQFDSYLDI